MRVHIIKSLKKIGISTQKGNSRRTRSLSQNHICAEMKANERILKHKETTKTQTQTDRR